MSQKQPITGTSITTTREKKRTRILEGLLTDRKAFIFTLLT